MSVKALRNQLLAAIAMVLVAAIALGSSTFAWFAANMSVTAETVSISAKSDQPFLQISKAANGTYATSTTLDQPANTVSDLLLTTPLNLSGNLVDYKATQATEDSAKTTPTAADSPSTLLWGTAYSTDVTQVQAGNVPWNVTSNLAQYALTTHVYIRTSENTQGYKLKMELPTVNDGTNSIPQAFRILAVAADGKWALYDNDGTNVKVTHCSDGYLVETIGVENGTKPYDDITIYVYFDGKDDDSYTVKASDLSAITSNLVFSCSATNS